MFHPQGPTLWELAVQALSSTERGYDLLAPKFEFKQAGKAGTSGAAHLGSLRCVGSWSCLGAATSLRPPGASSAKSSRR